MPLTRLYPSTSASALFRTPSPSSEDLRRLLPTSLFCPPLTFQRLRARPIYEVPTQKGMLQSQMPPLVMIQWHCMVSKSWVYLKSTDNSVLESTTINHGISPFCPMVMIIAGEMILHFVMTIILPAFINQSISNA